MVNPFDAEARLAEGRPAVDGLAEYVLACQRLGYQNPDLTARASQVRDWYDSESGLDLRALDRDCAALARAAAAAEDAARTQTDLVADMTVAWSGEGATAAREFASRSCRAAASVSSAVRRSADGLATLRDEVWRAVDEKVATVQAIDGRHRADSAQWLAAARTVTTGVGDLASASEIVDQKVKPFIDTEIGSDWVGAMRSATASIDAAYDAAITRATVDVPPAFDVPGELGPRATSAGRPESQVETIPASASPVATVPTGIPSAATTSSPPAAPVSGPAWSGSPPAYPSPTMSAPIDPGASAALTPPAAAVPAASPMPSMGDLGGGAPALGSGVSGFGQQLADLIGGLVGSAESGADLGGTDGSVDDPSDPSLDDPAADETDEPTDTDETDEPTDETDEEESSPHDVEDPVAGEPGAEPIEEVASECAPEPTSVPPPPIPDGLPAVPPAVPESVAETAGQTPCEIAADELPQVGE